MPETPFEGWALLELMGHRQRPGYVKEVEIAGGKMLRVDIPTKGGDVTEFYGVQAVYALRPCSEEIVRGEITRWNDPRPVRPVEYRDPEPTRLTHSTRTEDADDHGGERDDHEQERLEQLQREDWTRQRRAVAECIRKITKAAAMVNELAAGGALAG